jgi:hypothetical protein
MIIISDILPCCQTSGDGLTVQAAEGKAFGNLLGSILAQETAGCEAVLPEDADTGKRAGDTGCHELPVFCLPPPEGFQDTPLEPAKEQLEDEPAAAAPAAAPVAARVPAAEVAFTRAAPEAALHSEHPGRGYQAGRKDTLPQSDVIHLPPPKDGLKTENAGTGDTARTGAEPGSRLDEKLTMPAAEKEALTRAPQVSRQTGAECRPDTPARQMWGAVMESTDRNPPVQNPKKAADEGVRSKPPADGNLPEQAAASYRETAAPFSQHVQAAGRINLNRILNPLLEEIQVQRPAGEDVIRVRLKPASLGEVVIEMFRQDDRVAGRVTVENPLVREVIEANLTRLREKLAEQGVELAGLDVSLGDGSGRWQEKRGVNSRVNSGVFPPLAATMPVTAPAYGLATGRLDVRA